MAEYSDIIKNVDSSLDTFDKASLKAQKRLMEKIQLLSKDLDVDSAGNIKTTIANLRQISRIKSEIAKVVCDDKYKDAVTKLCESFETIYHRQHDFYKNNFEEGTISETASKKQKLLRQLAVENTIEGLTGAGIQAQITDKLTDMLTRSVTSGARWTDMVKEMRSYLDPEGDGTGAFARYAKTYATTAMGQFTGQNNKLMTDALDAEWYMYVGSNIETTREFCQLLTKKRYVHVSEIPEIVKGHIDGRRCERSASTGLPLGMINGTTPENFQVNVGGWNCRHQLIPVAKEAVPADIRKKIAEKIQLFQESKDRISNVDYTGKDPNSIKDELNKINAIRRCFVNGDFESIEVFNSANGETDMKGHIRLRAEKLENIASAINTIADGHAADLKDIEKDALQTLWHEILHNSHDLSKGSDVGDKFDERREYMEVANDFVAKNTMSDFLEILGVKKSEMPSSPAPEHSDSGYADKVIALEKVIDFLDLNKANVINSLRKSLLDGDYGKLKDGIVDALISGGLESYSYMKGGASVVITRADIEKILTWCNKHNAEREIIRRISYNFPLLKYTKKSY